MKADGHCARTFRCLHRQAKKKGKGEERETPVCPLSFIVIPLMILQVGKSNVVWPQLYWGQLSARLCWNYGLAFCPQHTDLAVTLNVASPEPDKFYHHIFPTLLRKSTQLTNPQPIQPHQQLPLASYLISDIMGKSDLCEQNLLRFMGNKGMCWKDGEHWELTAFTLEN